MFCFVSQLAILQCAQFTKKHSEDGFIKRWPKNLKQNMKYVTVWELLTEMTI